MLRPATDWELAILLADAAEKSQPLEVQGTGTRRLLGRPVQSADTLSTRALRAITLYEPSELVMTARAGTPVADIERELERNGQMLAFEPIDVGPLLGQEAGGGTIGSVFAMNLSGARRLASGSARDHLLGLTAVTGKGEMVRVGGRVMKNVTGYDVGRALAGSWGTLGVITEVSFKVVPAPAATATLVIAGLPDEIGIEVLCAAVATPYEVSGAVHLQAPLAGRLSHPGIRALGASLTAVRVENFANSAAYRIARLTSMLAPYGDHAVLDTQDSLAFWNELREIGPLGYGTSQVWRISTKPRLGPKVVAGIARYMPVVAYYDWAGGLIWLDVPATADAGATDVRRIIALHGGHATLIRAEAPVRAAIEVFQPLDPGIERLTRRLKTAFDPAGILNPGRMYATL